MKNIFFPLFFLAASIISNASLAIQDLHIPYYGQEFNRIKNQLKNDELKNKLSEVLKSGHVHDVNSQSDDQILKTCDSVKNCTMQTTLGYDHAREFLFGKFYLVQLDQGFGVQEMYCDRVYIPADFKNNIGLPAPGIVPEGTVINTEHTWPQSRFTGKYSKDLQKADLHHLFPTDSQMNSLRGSSIFGEVVKDTHKTKCNASKYGQGLGTTHDVFEPPQQHKGRVARALFYFSIRYDIAISEAEEVILKKWNHESPVDDQEIQRNNVIQTLQGNRNPFIAYPELADQIQDS